MPNHKVLNFYKQMTNYTEPGEYRYLYEDLPNALPELCKLIKCQMIHPDQTKKFKINGGARREDQEFSDVQGMLKELLVRNPEGITSGRKPSERLILSCRFHALLLVSILRFKGIPARVRAGFASYLCEDQEKYCDHWICEFWDGEWKTVDPDIQLFDVEEKGFLYAGEAWLMVQEHSINPKLFGVKKWWGEYYIRNNLCLDLNCVLGMELRYGELPPICRKDMAKMSFDELQLLEEAAYLLQYPDGNFELIKKLYDENDGFHYK